ncbi:FecR family protein [Acinetobacter sp. C26M]|uniref:FecR domain-containing protein n=1 Tax=unclassified Acinetobacter TaxID=196816 RepID=UPI002036DE4B|nr:MULTISPECIES: FecR family protein [unclassified Acinetobacter]USA44959.1 FecR family protein [Acinetobacter sp. C26M]USA48462.1 FecR family protein [Acinetobacter sp. C26G]
MSQTQILKEAAEWIVLIQASALTEAQQLEFENWKSQSEAHQTAWIKAELLLKSLECFPEEGYAIIKKGNQAAQFQWTKHLVVACIACLGSIIAWSSDYKYLWLSDYSTATGEQQSVTLEDGTQLQLNTDTALDVRYTPHLRTLRLHYGEIQIHTAKETQNPRPFYVETDSAHLQALGTIFNVQYLKNKQQQTCLGVIESAVKVTLSQSRKTTVVHAGEQLCFDDTDFKALGQLDPNVLVWKNQMIMAFEMPLEQLFQEIGRYQHQYVDLAPQLKALKVSGSYPVNNLTQLQSALELTYPIRMQRHLGDRVITIQAKNEKGEK